MPVASATAPVMAATHTPPWVSVATPARHDRLPGRPNRLDIRAPNSRDGPSNRVRRRNSSRPNSRSSVTPMVPTTRASRSRDTRRGNTQARRRQARLERYRCRRRGRAHTGETVLVPRFVSGWLWLVGNFDGLPAILREGTVVCAALSGNGGVPTSCDVMRPCSGFARYPDDCCPTTE
jgi:hypothetical protein